ncbi:hypothetical protein ACHAW6_007532 [Cyclotella cf. meneghiniana]
MASSARRTRSRRAAVATAIASTIVIVARLSCHGFSLTPPPKAIALWKHGGDSLTWGGSAANALYVAGNGNDGGGDSDGASGEAIYYDDFDLTDTNNVGGDNSLVVPDKSSSLPGFDDRGVSNGVSIPDDVAASTLTSTLSIDDLTGSNLRQFSLGSDLVVSDYAGSLGFDRVTDWQYYLQGVDDRGNIDDTEQRIPVNPRMDPSKPARTRSSSGAVVRLFRGEFTGTLAGKLRSRGMDNRVWIKEYSKEATHLATNEMTGLAKLMSSWITQLLLDTNNDSQKFILQDMQAGLWIQIAQRRYVDGITDTPTKQDDDNLLNLLAILAKQKAPFTALLGEMNLNDYYDDTNIDPNDWYKALGVKPPSPGSTWLVFDYHGLATASSYAVPMRIQQAKLPPKRGVFGNIIPPPPLPPFRERARYMVQGILKQMLTAVALAHEAGIVHNSLGRNSFLLSSVGQDKREAVSPYSVVVERLRVVLADWGFSESIQDAVNDEEFRQRAKSFGIPSGIGNNNTKQHVAMEFSKAEDLHALGFVFLALLFTTLAEPATLSAPMPPTDDDSWQRLFSEIFEKDMDEFRDYCTNEEVWANVVELLDMEEGAGWSVLGALLLARERVVEWFEDAEERQLTSARMLLSSPFFQMKII